MKNTGESGHEGNYLLGNVYASIRELDSAFTYYEKAIEGREAFVLWIRFFVKNVPEFWADPRAELLMEKIGLPNKQDPVGNK